MWLVVGLGNPGSKYERNRHNIGFRVVDELASKHGLSWKSGGKLGGDTASGVVTTERGRERAVLLKPLEFMNLSGFAVQRTAQFHSIETPNILVVHDELDLDFGIVRLKSGGGHGGHNGLRSMIEQLGEPGFARVRMGIGRDPKAPPGSKDAAGWVLSDVPAAQASVLSAVIAAGCEDIESVLAKGIGPAMNQHNARPNLSPVSATP
jgi:peptidyl-tRNA hydrolase, PTH1 family